MRAIAAMLPAVAFMLTMPVNANASDEDVDPRVLNARKKVFAAVVQIDVHSKRFSGGEKETVRGTGSGVVIDDKGHILTNFHVAHDAEKLIVTLVNKERVHATLVGSDHWTDLALLRLDPEELARKASDLPWAYLGSSAQIAVGEPVLAMGTPFGLSRTMTSGIITNNERYFSGDSIDGFETGDFNNWLQTDAAINPGNSGGPMVNMRGEVVGINTRGIQFGDGLGFAVPIDVAKEVVAQLLEKGKVERSYIGIRIKEMVDLEGHYGLQANRGALIQSVDLNSPARDGGVRAEDILLAINGTDVSARFPEEIPPIRKIIGDLPHGSEVTLSIQRGEEKLEIKVTTVELESQIAEDEAEFKEWGCTARSVTAAHARREKLADTSGVLVTGTKSASPARQAGLQGGDVIKSVDRKPVAGIKAFHEIYKEVCASGKDKFVIEIQRGLSEMPLVIKLENK